MRRAHRVGARLAALAALAARASRLLSRRRALALARALGLALAIAPEADVRARPRTWEMWWRYRGDTGEMYLTEQAAREGGLGRGVVSSGEGW